MEPFRPAVGIVPMARGAARALMFALLAGVVGVGAHLAGGGALPANGLVLLGVAGLAGPATFLAQALATRHRSTWRAFVALGGGQLGIELVLQGNDRALEGPLATAAVHLLANLALGVMLVGTDRALADLAAALDRILPRLDELLGRCALRAVARPAERAHGRAGLLLRDLPALAAGTAALPRSALSRSRSAVVPVAT